MNMYLRESFESKCTYNGISKVILVKGGHGLENVCLNVFSVTISSVRTIGLPASFL
jgi:hypothetical protein